MLKKLLFLIILLFLFGPFLHAQTEESDTMSFRTLVSLLEQREIDSSIVISSNVFSKYLIEEERGSEYYQKYFEVFMIRPNYVGIKYIDDGSMIGSYRSNLSTYDWGGNRIDYTAFGESEYSESYEFNMTTRLEENDTLIRETRHYEATYVEATDTLESEHYITTVDEKTVEKLVIHPDGIIELLSTDLLRGTD
jgi:hypothetical protein